MSSFDEYYKKWKKDNNITDEIAYNPNMTYEEQARGAVEANQRFNQLRSKREQERLEQENKRKEELKKQAQLPIKNLKSTQTVTKGKDKNISQPAYRNITTPLPTMQIASKEERENINKYGSNDAKEEIEARVEAEKINKEIEKGGWDKANAIVSNTLTSVGEGGRSVGTGLASAALIPTATALSGINKGYNFITGNKEETGIDRVINNILDTSEDLYNQTNYQRTNSKIENNFARGAGIVGNQIGRMVTSSGFGPLGLTVMSASAGGNAAQENLDKDRSNLGRSTMTGVLKGALEYGTEMITGGNKLGEGGLDKKAVRFIGDRIKSKVGQKVASRIYEGLGEILEERVSDIGGYIIDTIINNKDLPSWEEFAQDRNETWKQTALTQLVLTALGMGGDTYGDVQEYLKDKNAQKYFNEAQRIVDQENLTEKLKNDVANEAIARAEANEGNKNIAIKEINESRINNEEKQQMLQALNSMENVTDEDLNAIRQTISTINESNLLPTNETYKENQQRRQTYMKYKNDSSDYNSSVVNSVLDTIPANRNGNRTVNQWLQAADNIGQQLADLSNEEIEKIAYKSWFDLQPTKNITQYDNQAKQKVGFQKLTSDEWVNTINNAVNQARANNQVETSQQTKQVTEEDYLTHNPNYYDGDQFDFNAHRNKLTNKAITDIVNLIENSTNIKEDLIKAYQENENSEGNHNTLNTGLDEDNRFLYQYKESVLNDFIDNINKGRDVKTTELYRTMKEHLTNIAEKSKLPVQQQTSEQTTPVLPTNKTMNPTETSQETTQGEQINWNEIERPEGKFRKHYQSIIESSNTTAEAKAIAKEMIGLDTYVPQSNTELLNKADARISTTNADTELNSLFSRVMNNEKVNDVDIAVGERLIEYYSKIGDSQHLMDAIHATAMAGTQAGRTVQAMALLNHMTPQGQVVWLQRSIEKMNNELQQRYRKNAPQFELTDDMVNRILNTENQEQMYDTLDEIYDELGQQVPKTFAEQIDEWRYFSMLANVKTHARNVIGNVAMGGVQRLKNKVAGAIEGVVAQFNPDMERTHTLKRASEKTKNFAKTDVQNLDVQTELGMNENKYNPQSRLQNSRKTFKSDVLNNTIGKLFDFNSKALEIEDNIGLKAAYVNSLSDYITANNIDVENITDQQLAKARQHAIKEAQEATFHQASALATALNQMGRKNNIAKFALDAVVPFKKTPINVAKTGIQYSPVGLIKSAVYDVGKVRKGNMSVNQYIDNISKGLTGTGLAYLGYALAQAGILKASGGDDDKKNEYDKEQGKQPYSLEVGGKSASLDWLSPVGIPLFIGAEINQQFNSTKKEKTSKSTDDEQTLNKIINRIGDMGTAFSNAIQPMSEMSMVSGLTSVLSSYNKEAAAGNMFVNSVKSYINQFVPTALSQVARTTDDYERTTKSTKTGILPRAIDTTANQIKSKIPGLRETLPIKTDIWGQKVEQSANLPFRAFNNFFNPSTVKDISDDKVDKELNRLYADTRDSSIIPKAIDKKFSSDGQEYRFTNEEYAKYNQKYGETAYNLINDLISTSSYKNMTSEQKQKAISEIYSYAKEQIKYDYMKANKIEFKESTMSKVVNKLNKSEKANYFDYLANTKGLEKNSEKLDVLANAKYSDSAKKKIYENSIGKDDELYDTMKKSDININQYLKYKTQKFESDKEDDGTEKGKTISGSKKKKVVDYINNMDITYNQKLLLLGTQYSLSNAEKRNLANYVNGLGISKEQKLEIFGKLTGFTVYKDGRVKY